MKSRNAPNLDRLRALGSKSKRWTELMLLSSHPAPHSSRRAPWLAPATLAGVILLAYSGTLHAPFVYDDMLAIPENATIRRLWPISAVLMPQAEGGLTVSGRPVLNLSFAINYAISGTDPWSYHVFNVLVHVCSALVLFGIVRRTVERQTKCSFTGCNDVRGSRDRRLADNALHLGFVVAAVWALHPLLTQGVTYTVQRAESLMGFFYLMTLYAFVRALECPSRDRRWVDPRGWLGLSIVSCLLGMGTKEVMVSAPLVVLLYDRTFVAGSLRDAWRERWRYYFALGATWLVLLALVLSTGGNRGGTVGVGVGVPLWAYPLTQFKAIATYLARVVWPHPLVFEYGTFWVNRAADIVPYAALVIPLIGATVLALRRRTALGFCGAWVFLILAPTSLAPGTIQMIVEHRMYLPSAAVAVVATVAVYRSLGQRVWWALGLLALGLLVRTCRRNHDYRTHVALWNDTVAKRPENPRGHDGLAEAFAQMGRLNEALEHRREATRLRPDESKYHHNLAMTLADAGRLDEAVRHYQMALRLEPDQPRTHNNLAILLQKKNAPALALSHYAEAVRLKPSDPLYHYNYGIGLMRAGRDAEAAASFEAALRFEPDHADAHFNLGTALLHVGRIDAALVHYSTALRLKPQDTEYRTNFGGALLLAQRPEEALTQFRTVLATQPDAVEANFGAGNALASQQRFEEAIAHYGAVLQRAPEHANAHFKLGNVFLDLSRIREAVPHYRAALRQKPDDAEAHHNLGVAHARLEQWAEARAEFESALRLKPDYVDARRHLEQLRTVLGR
jgi:protein O-mannosyl-transferase